MATFFEKKYFYRPCSNFVATYRFTANRYEYFLQKHHLIEIISHFLLNLSEFRSKVVPVKLDVSNAKNYLDELELEGMGRFVNAVVDLAERMAKRHISMTMKGYLTIIAL